jgi:hypothetical protein
MTKKLKILIVAGDGIGPEVTGEAVRVLQSVAELGGYDFAFQEELIGGVAIKAHGSPLPDSTLKAALDSDAVLLGAVGGNEFNALPPSQRPEAGLLKIRAELGGFANLRPSFAWPGLSQNSPLRPEIVEGADILFVRELLGGLYFGAPREWDKRVNAAWNTMRYTRDEVVRVTKVAFELASKAPEEGDVGRQGERARSFAAVARDRDRSGQRVSRHRARTSVCGRDGDAHHEPAAELRCGPHGEFVWRHPVGRGRRDHRLAGHAAVGDDRRQGEFVRTGARIGAGHRRAKALRIRWARS